MIAAESDTLRRMSPEVAWADEIPDEQWQVYERVIEAGQRDGLRFLLGGAFALATYTGHWRNTKDLDLYILPEERGPAIRLLSSLGLRDYYDELPYQRHWIYRAVEEHALVDAIWQMPNDRAAVDESWFRHATHVRLRGQEVAVLPAEELIWAKIYVLQRDRCDWPDIFTVLDRVGPDLDWERLLGRLADDAPLLAGVLSVFRWLCPGVSQMLPHGIWERLRLAPPPRSPAPPEDPRRIDLLDTRAWFGPMER